MRFGPRRERLSRSEYLSRMREQEAAAQARVELRDAASLRKSVETIVALMDEREDLADARDREQNEREVRLAQLEQTMARHADAARSITAEVVQKAGESSTEAERLSRERTELAETRRSLEDREATLAKREREVETQRSRNEARERDLDASLAAVEAVGEGLVIYEDADGHGRLRVSKSAQINPSLAELLAHIKKAPDAAIRVGRRLAATLALQRQKAREQGLAEGRAEARAEWASELSAVRAAARSITAVHAFARKLITRLPAREKRRPKLNCARW